MPRLREAELYLLHTSSTAHQLRVCGMSLGSTLNLRVSGRERVSSSTLRLLQGLATEAGPHTYQQRMHRRAGLDTAREQHLGPALT